MGEGQEVKTRNDSQAEIQERGDIFFFYRPKMGREAAHSAEDVQRLYRVLRFESGERPVLEKQDPHKATVQGGPSIQEGSIEKQSPLRFIVMGKRRVFRIQPNGAYLTGDLWRWSPPASMMSSRLLKQRSMTLRRRDTATAVTRALGKGVYRIVRHKSRGKKVHTRLIYRLEFPPEDEKQEPQESLNVHREGSFLIQIKNTEQHQQQHGKRKAAFPAHLQAQFGQLRYIPADPPDFLNYKGCELRLISASDNIEEELGIELIAEGEGDPSCSDLLKTFGDTVTVDALLLGGNWV